MVGRPLERLLRFFREEYDYYDAIGDDEPDRITPLDVIVTAAVNARIGRASELRRIHRGVAERCDRLLAEIPRGADILEWEIAGVAEVVHEAAQVDGVAIAVATKILHRKRPDLIPMLDSVLVKHYFHLPQEQELPLRLYDKGRMGEVATELLEAARVDVAGARAELNALREGLASEGFRVTRVRTLDALLWTEYEARGYYRDPVE